MDEEAIAAKLRQNIPQPIDQPVVPTPTVSDPVLTPVHTGLDEITQYKLHDYFGEQYKPSDEVSHQRVQYIYEQVSKMIEHPEYGFVLAKIRDLERMIGIAQDNGRIYKLYQWLKLDNTRRSIEAEMGAIPYE